MRAHPSERSALLLARARLAVQFSVTQGKDFSRSLEMANETVPVISNAVRDLSELTYDRERRAT
jgi:hypothetical protein